MNVKPIEWKECEGHTIGYCGGIYLFKYGYNIGKYANAPYYLTSKLPLPMREFNTRKECEDAAMAMLQKFHAKITI